MPTKLERASVVRLCARCLLNIEDLVMIYLNILILREKLSTDITFNSRSLLSLEVTSFDDEGLLAWRLGVLGSAFLHHAPRV